MESLTIGDFEQWANSEMTIKVRDHLLKIRAEHDSISEAAVVQRAIQSDAVDLSKIGMAVIAKAAMIQGIEAFTDFDRLCAELFEEQPEGRNNG